MSEENEANPTSHHWLVWVSLAILLYVFSIGPTFMVLDRRPNSFQRGWPAPVRLFYFPIIQLSNCSPALDDALSWYFGLWEVKR